MERIDVDWLVHELKTPLTAISTWNQLIGNLEEKGKLTPKLLRESVARIEEETARLAQLIDRLRPGK
jgi:signal transduction histidine kinase